MTTKPGRPGINRVHVRRKDGTIKVYEYERKAKTPSYRLSVRGGGLRQIAKAYTSAPEFRALSESWQTATRYYLGILEDRLDWMTLDDINDRRARGDFYAVRDAYADKPAKADKIMGTLATALAWAYERGMIDANHARGIDRLSATGARADKIWAPEQLAALLAHAKPDLSRLVRVGLYTAARLSDVLAFDWGMVRGDWLEYKPGKTAKSTGVVVRLPWRELAPLRDVLAECGPRDAGPILTTEARGIPWTVPNFNARWKATLAVAGLLDADRHFHDLRGTAITRMLEAGATHAEVASISGHAVGGRSTLRAYAARSDAMALGAYRKWNAALATGPAVLAFQKRGAKTGGAA